MKGKKIISLIRTAPAFPPGSMKAYASLVKEAARSFREYNIREVDFFDPNGGGAMRRHHLWRLHHTRTFFQRHPADLYHLTDGSMAGFLPRAMWDKTIVTVHDLIPLLQMKRRIPGQPGLMGRLLIRRTLRALKRAHGLIADSRSTARDLAEFTGRNDSVVIPVPLRPLPVSDSSVEVPDRYLFHVGNNGDYKNRIGVLDVFAQLQDIDDLHLIMAGPAPTPQMKKKADALKRVEFRENVTDAELSMLYANASVFLFPSLYEGFGMPVLEAMQAGCPVVCSDVASLPEVAGDAAKIIRSNDLNVFSKHCRILLENHELRNELVEKGRARVIQFSAEQFSVSLKDCYTDCFNRIGGK